MRGHAIPSKGHLQIKCRTSVCTKACLMARDLSSKSARDLTGSSEIPRDYRLAT